MITIAHNVPIIGEDGEVLGLGRTVHIDEVLVNSNSSEHDFDAACYALGGFDEPNFPMPATIGLVDIDRMGVFVYASDEKRPNPLTSYWRNGPVDYMEEWN